MMEEYSEECILTFLRNQGQLFDEPVAENYDEAEAFLEWIQSTKCASTWMRMEWMWKVCRMGSWRKPAKYLRCPTGSI